MAVNINIKNIIDGITATARVIPIVNLDPAEHRNIRKEYGGHKDRSGFDDDDSVDDGDDGDDDDGEEEVDDDNQVDSPILPPPPGPGFADIFKTPKRFFITITLGEH